MRSKNQQEALFYYSSWNTLYMRSKKQQEALFDSQFISIIDLHMFRARSLLIIRR